MLASKLPRSRDVASQVLGRIVMAKLLAVKGRGDQAERTAHEAVANLALAEVLLLANRREGAIGALEAAVEASDRKGNIVTAGQARALLAGL